MWLTNVVRVKRWVEYIVVVISLAEPDLTSDSTQTAKSVRVITFSLSILSKYDTGQEGSQTK